MAATLLEQSLSEHKSLARFHAQVVESKEVDEKMATKIGNSIQALKIYRENSELALFHAEKSFDEVDEAYSEAIEVTLASKRHEASEEMEKSRAKRVADFEAKKRQEENAKKQLEETRKFENDLLNKSFEQVPMAEGLEESEQKSFRMELLVKKFHRSMAR